ncbi:MAG: hypothetical protein J5787_08230 [Alphaproteobacteria bacterium]|nr:hypothetical protein [Alphaproteobacteria bacterium]
MTDEKETYTKESLGRNEDNTGTDFLLKFGDSEIRYTIMDKDERGREEIGIYKKNPILFSPNDMTPEEKALFESGRIDQAALSRVRTIERAEREKTKEQTEQKEPANKTTFIELNGRKAAVTSVGKDADGNDQYVFLTEDGKNFIPFTKTADGKIKLDVDQRDFQWDESMVPDGLNLQAMMGIAVDKAIAAQLKANLKTTTMETTKPSDARASEPQQPVQNGNAVEQVQNQSRANEVSARNTMEAAQSARTAPNNSNAQANTQVNNALMSRDNGGR